jgi:integrase
MGGKRIRLSKRTVDAVQASDRDQFVWDSEVLGFGLKVSRQGLRTYVVQYRSEGRSRRFTIGAHGSPWTPETARDRAKVLLGQVADGEDPQEEKAGLRKSLTVAELCDLYLTVGLATRKPASVASARADIENHIKPLLGAHRAAAVTPADVDKLLLDVAAGVTAHRAKTSKKRGLSRVRGGKGAANAAVTTLCAAMTFAIRRGVRADNPALRVRKFPEKKIDRFLAPAELARLGEVLAAAEALGVENPYALAAIRLLVLTGCRKNEILTLKRAHVDPHHKCLRLPDSKTGAKVVHIGDAALEVIAAVPELVGNDHLLPGKGGAGHLVHLQSTWERIREAAGLKGVRLHDLRHAFASLGAAQGDSLLIIGALLGHRSAKTTQRYAHLADHPMKDAAQRISAEAAARMGLKRSKKPEARRADVVPAPPGTLSVLGAVIDTQWLDTTAAASLLESTVRTLQTWRSMGLGPRFRKIGRRVVYAEGDVLAFKAEQAAAKEAGRLSRVQAA